MASQSMKCLTLTATALLLCGTAQPVLAQGMDLGTLVLDTFEDGNTEVTAEDTNPGTATGTKVPVRLTEVPQAVAVLGRDEI